MLFVSLLRIFRSVPSLGDQYRGHWRDHFVSLCVKFLCDFKVGVVDFLCPAMPPIL